jgi:hypothetical protein
VAACHDADLSVSASAPNAGVGHAGIQLSFTNSGSASCKLTGYPGVAALNAAGAQQLQATRTLRGYLSGLPDGDDTIPVVTLQPGQSAMAGLEWEQGGNSACTVYPAILTTPPNTAHSTKLTIGQLSVCGAFDIHPVTASS